MSAVFPPQGSFPLASSFSSSFTSSFDGSLPPPPTAGGGKRGTGLIAVLLFHVLLAWALASGLAREAVEIIKKPIQMAIIPDVVVPPPPPPPPPKVEKIREIPKLRQAPPPPAFVPQPDVKPTAAPPTPVIQAVQAEVPKEPVVIAAPPAPAPAPTPAAPAVVKQEVSLACPGYQQVLAQTLEDAFDRVGIAGTVRTLLKVRGSQVIEAVPQSGPKEYYKYVQTAVKRMHCSAGGADEVLVSLDVQFRR